MPPDVYKRQEYTCTVTNAEDGKRPVSATGAAVTLSVQKGTQEAPDSLTGVAPSSVDGVDGKIIGLEAGHSYEYQRMDGGAYTGAGSLCVEITGLSAGTYLVRLAGDDNYHPSPDAVVLVPSYTAPTVPVTGIALNKSSLALTVGGSETLTVTVSPQNATNKNVSWTTGDSSVATVENGVVTAKAVGRTTITAASTESGKTAVCTITVNAAPTAVSYTHLHRGLGDVQLLRRPGIVQVPAHRQKSLHPKIQHARFLPAVLIPTTL